MARQYSISIGDKYFEKPITDFPENEQIWRLARALDGIDEKARRTGIPRGRLLKEWLCMLLEQSNAYEDALAKGEYDRPIVTDLPKWED